MTTAGAQFGSKMDDTAPDSPKTPTQQAQKENGKGKGKGPTTAVRQVSPNTEKSESTKGGRNREATPGNPRLPIFHKKHREFKSADYAIRSETFGEVVDSIGVGEPIINSFSTPSNTLCEKFWDLQRDALSQSWTGRRLLWMNPPFSLLEKVVTRIACEKEECFLLCPNWKTTLWWVKVQALCAKAHFFPPGTRQFETERGPSGPIKWGVWVVYIFKAIQTASVRITNHLGRDRQMKVKIGWEVGGEELPPVLALIDTGAEVCLVNNGLNQSVYFNQPSVVCT